MKNFKIIKSRNQQGYILATGLILLIILAILALYASGSSINEEKMAGALEDRQIALQNAEKALRVAEDYVYTSVDTTSDFVADCTGGLCTSSSTTPVWTGINWESDTAHTFVLSGTDVVPQTLKQPRFIVELLDIVPAPPGESAKITSGASYANAYRITAVGWGNKKGTSVMLQSVFVKR